jgi:hypothetical protein
MLSFAKYLSPEDALRSFVLDVAWEWYEREQNP